jgi:TolB-like protein/cytochrome c-type biogenesis protein CcmH/NrfG
MSAEKDQEYMADGMAEELLNLLAKVPDLKVIARTSSFAFKGEKIEIAEIARKLNVAHILEGSVRTSGDKIRITAQLIRAADSTHLWSQTYDRTLEDIFAVQDEIAAAVVEQLKIKLLAGAPKASATDSQTYSLFLQARSLSRRFDSRSFDKPIALYKQALATDPTYAPAWDGLADVYFSQVDFGVVSAEQGLPLARAAADRALDSDPTYAPVYARLALLAGIIELDLATAARHVERGLAIDPANLEVISSAAYIGRQLQRWEQAIALGQHVVSRDPFNEQAHDRLAMIYLSAGRLDDALAEFQIAVALSPGFASERHYIGRIYLLQGDAEAALAEMRQEPMESWRLVGLAMAFHALGRKVDSDAALNEAISKYGKVLATVIAYAMAYRGETDEAFEMLESADYFGASIMANHAMLTGLHSDPRWLPFLRKLGMAPEQLAAIKFDIAVPN